MKKLILVYLSLLFLVSISNAAITVKERTESVDLHSGVRLYIYPNPFKDLVNIEVEALQAKPTVLRIYDIIGVEKLSLEINDENYNGHIFKVQIKELKEGIYFCNVYSHNTLLQSKKIICTK